MSDVAPLPAVSPEATPRRRRSLSLRAFMVVVLVAAAAQTAFVPGIAQRVMERRSDRRYNEAIDLIQRRDDASYPRAIALLEEIPEGSALYNDARALMLWIDADIAVRRARGHFDERNIAEATRLLDQAIGVAAIGVEARRALEQRHARWVDVASTYDQACAADRQGDLPKAATLYSRVLELESSPRNRYRAMSQSRLSEIEALRGRAPATIKGNLK